MQTVQPDPATENTSRLETVAQLRAQLAGILADAETLWETAPKRRGAQVLRFRGHMIAAPEEGYPLLRQRFAALGYTPILRQEGEYQVVTALPIVFASSTPKRWWINLVLFLLTIASTTLVGAVLEQELPFDESLMHLFQNPRLLLSGIPASLTIMGILTVHEFGHYFAARKHGLDSSLPYFIPLPFGLIGTMGAIIRMRTPWEDRDALFDVGAAGPLAGIAIALPLFFIGLMVSPALPPQPDGMPLGTPLLLRWMEDVVYVLRGIPQDYDIYVNSWAFTAWFAVFVSGLNLLPIGQLDGGHVAYAVLGDRMRVLSTGVIAVLGALGIFLWSGWYMWIGFSFLSGWMHPPPLNALAPLSKTRRILGYCVFALMVLLFTPAPFPTL
jgi:membrane-associated protease RseP (regulator of RpoE activity)